MSLARTSNALRRWQCLYDKPPLSLSTSCIPNNTRLWDNRTPRNTKRRTTSIQTTRSFHCTASCYAARSPRAQARTQRLRPAYSSDGLFNVPAHGDLTARLKHLDEKGPLLWESALAEGFLDDKVTQKTFLDIAKRLLETAHREPPSADAIQDISSDPDLIFQIGYIASGGNPSFRAWLLASTTHAGARIPVLMSAARYLHSLRDNTAPVRTPTLQKIEHLAYHDRDPRAMTLHAKILGLRKRYAEALALIEQAMALIYPSKIPVAKDGGFAMAKIDPPWQVYSWLKEKAQANTPANTKTGKAAAGAEATAGDDLLRSAALVYHDPESLVQYAAARLQAGDLAMYEDCLRRAATAGNAEACRRLANFYYLTSLGRYPRRGVREDTAVDAATKSSSSPSSQTEDPSNRGKFSALLTTVFGPRPRAEYRKLATEWYELAFSHGNEQAALVLAVLLREDGSASRGLQLLEQIERSPSLGRLVRRIKAQWEDRHREVGIPAELLDV
ncbi:hypothetical protein CNMCM5793_000814 [Aspergillus hiratsukae]|uniref:Uncharacterized protein n=1 Tax=Aspergillus hiratsukae TaxID=1194566 RepID=A0A8H6PZA3_9EURO|nr:hypothetical protein CNMCM5793_000814 [Aspergillus hiratsukae]KAF7162934.1 hypothetical protein CNMCM6106_000059 [Aspergillus hiratsukae]